jgi:hypothetical protein
MSVAASNPKATGDADWVNPYSGQANTTFNAINISPNKLDAKGSLIYTDSNVTYTMDVQFLKVSGKTAWFAGQVTSVTPRNGFNGCCKIGNWVFYQVSDDREPGIGADQIWGEDLTQGEGIISLSDAYNKVSNRANPMSGPFMINGGNIQVH